MSGIIIPLIMAGMLGPYQAHEIGLQKNATAAACIKCQQPDAETLLSAIIFRPASYSSISLLIVKAVSLLKS